MKSLLNDIFNEIISKYKKFLSANSESIDSTKDTATNRLRFVLMHDRTNLSPETMEKMRDELVDVISKYVVIDTEALDLNLASEGDAIALLASIPILRAKTKEEQEEAILALEQKRKEAAEAIQKENEEESEEDSEDEISEEDLEDDEDSEEEDDDAEDLDELLADEAEEFDKAEDSEPEEEKFSK